MQPRSQRLSTVSRWLFLCLRRESQLSFILSLCSVKPLSLCLTARQYSPLAVFLVELLTLRVSLCQAEALDGGKRWKNEKVAEEKAPAAGFGSPSKGQAINLLDTVSGGTSRKANT